jgi:hypothetical protein
MNGFQATVGITNPNQGVSGTGVTSAVGDLNQDRFGVEGKASYSFAANDVTGKVWVSGIYQKVKGVKNSNAALIAGADDDMWSNDIGANINLAGFGLTGYYYNAEGVGTTMVGVDGYSALGKKRESDGGYVQATYVLPTKTKVGVSWGISNLDLASGESNATLIKENEMWTVGAYHPLTKHLNLVAEYSDAQSRNQSNAENKNKTGSLGAILFF